MQIKQDVVIKTIKTTPVRAVRPKAPAKPVPLAPANSIDMFVMNPVRFHGRGRIHCHGFPEGLINAGSQVLASISELQDEPPAVNVPHVGDAFMTVDNIVPNKDNNGEVVVYATAPEARTSRSV